MQFVDDRFVPWPACPFGRMPSVGRRIDDDARAVYIIGLGTGRRVRHHKAVWQNEAVFRSS